METPKTLNDAQKWKAAEHRFFALQLSVPLLGCYLVGNKRKYLLHWICFVEAILILSSDAITVVDLQKARVLLQLFVLQVASLYGPEFCALQVHMLTHLCDQGIFFLLHMY